MNTLASVSLQMTPLPYEVDFTGFVSNTVAPQWMERLRVLLMAQCFPEVDLKDATNLSVIRRAEVDYLRPIQFTDPIMGRAFIKKVLSSSWVVGFSFTNMITSDICLEGSQTGVFIDAMTLKPKRMPSLINQKLKSLEV
jgi:acyl-CoA thioester hydrolase